MPDKNTTDLDYLKAMERHLRKISFWVDLWGGLTALGVVLLLLNYSKV